MSSTSTNRKVDGPPDALNTYSPRLTNSSSLAASVYSGVLYS